LGPLQELDDDLVDFGIYKYLEPFDDVVWRVASSSKLGSNSRLDSSSIEFGSSLSFRLNTSSPKNRALLLKKYYGRAFELYSPFQRLETRLDVNKNTEILNENRKNVHFKVGQSLLEAQCVHKTN